MARFVAVWSEVALDHYLALSPEQQELINGRLAELVDIPDGARMSVRPGIRHLDSDRCQRCGPDRVHVPHS